MKTRLSEFRCKEVVNVCDGGRLGYLNDLEFELPEGRIVAIVVPGPPRYLGLFGHDGEYYIPWECIKRIGSDIILVDIDPVSCRLPRHKRPFFGEKG